MKNQGYQIMAVTAAAKHLDVRVGDRLLQVNGEPLLDFIDWNYWATHSHLEFLLERDGVQWSVALDKPADRAIGIELEDSLYPTERRCANRCCFCFVDQLPRGMRRSLYYKDDDWRYSVLFGNFVTLTNLRPGELERIVARQASPLNVSVHATDPDVRVQLMGNPRAGRILDQLRALSEGGIVLHTQAVILPGVNDGAVLVKTMEDLYNINSARTFAAVPVGLTAYRDGLQAIQEVTPSQARAVIQTVEAFARRAQLERGYPFAYAADEFYQIAQLPYPRYDDAEHNRQLGNGVGLCSEFLDGLEAALADHPSAIVAPLTVTLATGKAAFGLISQAAERLMAHFQGLRLPVVEVENGVFGSSVTVAGLLGGQDFIAALKDKPLGRALFLPEAALRDGIFIDDVSLKTVEQTFGVPTYTSGVDGYDLVELLLDLMEDME